jgi:cytochrome c biogenesis protein CcmG, thiol:disulfide interchange protein DsbE
MNPGPISGGLDKEMEMNSTEPPQEIAAPMNTKRGLSRWVYAAAFLVLIIFLGLIGWNLINSQQGSIVVGQSMSPFTLSTFDGNQLNTASLAGKVQVINFWASWCKPCEQEAAELEEAWQSYKGSGQVVFMGVNYVDIEPQALAYLKKFNITYPNGPDLGTKISQQFRVHAVPETYFIGRDGKLAYARKGIFYSTAEIKSIIDGLIK